MSASAQNSANNGKVGQQAKLFEKFDLQNKQFRTQYQMKATGQIAEAQNKQGLYFTNVVILKLNLYSVKIYIILIKLLSIRYYVNLKSS